MGDVSKLVEACRTKPALEAADALLSFKPAKDLTQHKDFVQSVHQKCAQDLEQIKDFSHALPIGGNSCDCEHCAAIRDFLQSEQTEWDSGQVHTSKIKHMIDANSFSVHQPSNRTDVLGVSVPKTGTASKKMFLVKKQKARKQSDKEKKEKVERVARLGKLCNKLDGKKAEKKPKAEKDPLHVDSPATFLVAAKSLVKKGDLVDLLPFLAPDRKAAHIYGHAKTADKKVEKFLKENAGMLDVTGFRFEHESSYGARNAPNVLAEEQEKWVGVGVLSEVVKPLLLVGLPNDFRKFSAVEEKCMGCKDYKFSGKGVVFSGKRDSSARHFDAVEGKFHVVGDGGAASSSSAATR